MANCLELVVQSSEAAERTEVDGPSQTNEADSRRFCTVDRTSEGRNPW